MKRALLIVDMLNDFVEDWGTLKVDGAKEIIPQILKQKEAFVESGEPIIYLCDSHTVNDDEFKLWPPHCVEGTKGAEVVDELKPGDTDIVIKKTTYSGFFGTNLNETLRALAVKELYITGVAMNICVHYTAADARMLGYSVTVPLDCVKGLTKEDEEYMKKQFKNVLNVNLIGG
ncbi:MAG: cysteine hydrolase family protein [Caldisericaceae bacterium]